MTALSAEERDLAERRSAAIHEAGHAIVSVGLHLKINHAILLPEGRWAGRVRVLFIDRWDTPTAHAHLPHTCAGYIAQQIADGSDCTLYDFLVVEQLDGDDGDDGDLQTAERLALDAYGTRGRAWLAIEQAWERTERWLRQPGQWAAVQELAAALESTSIVSGGEIYAIAEKHGVKSRDRALLPARRHFFIGEAA